MAGKCLWCGKKLSPDRRKDARYCNSSCRAEASRVRKTPSGGSETLRGAASGSRRRSRDGRGTRLYVTRQEIDLVRSGLRQLELPATPAALQFRRKLIKAVQRIDARRFPT